MKQELASFGVKLIDTKGIIQPTRNAPELDKLGFEYPWGKESPSEMTEAMAAMQGEQERKTLLKRTITKQILYTQQGYHIGRYDDGFIGAKINVEGRERYIQVPDPVRAKFIQKMFKLRAEHKLTDKEIVDYLNEQMGYTSKIMRKWSKDKKRIVGTRGGVKLTVKQLHKVIQRLTYIGIICEKWTHNKPIKAKHNGLVSIETFNKANRGKLFIEETKDGYKLLKNVENKNPQRLKYNPNFPFKCIRCPECGKKLKGSASRGKSGRYFGSYHCARGHKRFSVKKELLHKQVEEKLKHLKYSQDYMKLLEEIIKKKFETRITQMVSDKRVATEQLHSLEHKKEQVLEEYIATNNEIIKKALGEKLTKVEEQIIKMKSAYKAPQLTKGHIEKIFEYMYKIVEHPEKTLIDKENPLRQEKLLSLIYNGLPTYTELISGTPSFSFIFQPKIAKNTAINSAFCHLG